MLNCYSPSIKIIRDNIYVFWTDETTGNDDIYVMRRHLKENYFLPRKRITASQYRSIQPDIFEYGKQLHIVWTELNPPFSKIYYQKSDNYVTTPTVILEQKTVKHSAVF